MKKHSATSGIVKDIIIVVIGIAIIWVGLRVAFGTENPFYVVSSGSMVPNLNVFDVIVVNGNISFDHLKIGDIIVFNRPVVHDKVIVHRVAEFLNKNPLIIRTKGDANPGSIPGTDFPISKEDYIGKVVYVIPQIGYVTRILTPPINYVIIAVIIGIMIVKQFGKSKSGGGTFSSDNNLNPSLDNPNIASEIKNQADSAYAKSAHVDSTTILTSSANPSVFGQDVRFTAKVTAVTPTTGIPIGSVIFTIDGIDQSPVTISSTGNAIFVSSTLSLGTHTISAYYSGDSNHAASSSATLTQTVNQGDNRDPTENK